MKIDIDKLDPSTVTIEELLTIIRTLISQNASLKEKVADLERRLGLNSSNSGKPPSLDGLHKPSPKSQRTPTGKAFGGQKGHTGNTLNHVDVADETIACTVSECTHCHSSLDAVDITSIEERQEFDVIIKRHVRAYVSDVKICRCGHVNRGTFPEHIKSHVQYGETAKAVNVTLMNNFVPLKRLVYFNKHVLKLSLSETTLMSFYNHCSDNLTPLYHAIYKKLLAADLKHLDESGLRVGKKLHWIHVLCNTHLTYFCVKEKRGFLHEGLRGTVVHDGWKAYFTLDQVKHILCNAHHLRELIALVDFDKEPWAQKMLTLLKKAHKVWQRVTGVLTVSSIEPWKVTWFRTQYDAILNEGEVYHNERLLPNPTGRKRSKKRKGHCLIVRLRNFKESVLAFLSDPSMPFTNNEAERPLRPVKGKQKISGCFRTTKGADNFAIVRSAVSSFAKQGKDVVEELRKAIRGEYPVFDLLPAYPASP